MDDATDVYEHPSVTYDRAFMTLFVDGVHLLKASESESDYDIAASLARGSLACTMMLPEVVANVLIETLNLEASAFGDVDRMSALGKFDFYLRTNFHSRKLDRGMKAVQALQELKRLRDIFVHPKPQEVHWTPAENKSHTGESGRTPLLDMSKNPTMWYSDDAIKGMRAVHAFFSFYFVTMCRFKKGRVSNILFSEDAVPDKDAHTYHTFHRHFVRSLKEWNVDISYFKIGVA